MENLHFGKDTGDDCKQSETPSSDRNDILRPKDAAKYLNISISRIAKLRMEAQRADGPRYFKVAGCVLYRRDDLDAWVNAHAVEAV